MIKTVVDVKAFYTSITSHLRVRIHGASRDLQKEINTGMKKTLNIIKS